MKMLSLFRLKQRSQTVMNEVHMDVLPTKDSASCFAAFLLFVSRCMMTRPNNMLVIETIDE